MRTPRKPRNLSPVVREGIAQKHARFMGMHGDDNWKQIDRKIQDAGNDYYLIELFPNQKLMDEAQSDYDGYKLGTPAMNAVGEDMRQFYGLASPAAIKQELAVIKQEPTVIKEKPAVIKEKPAAVQGAPAVIVKNPEPEATKEVVQEAVETAEELKKAYINDILGYDVQKRYEDILKPKGYVIDDPLLEAVLFGSAALGLGGIGGAAISGNNENKPLTREELMEYQEANPGSLMVSYV